MIQLIIEISILFFSLQVKGWNGFLSVMLIFIPTNTDWRIMEIIKKVFSLIPRKSIFTEKS